MASNDYHLITVWRIPATPDEISAVLGDAPALARWCPSVYLAVDEVSPGDESGLGKVVDLYTKGFLPYTLRWRSASPRPSHRPVSRSRRVATSSGAGSGRSIRTPGRPTPAVR